MWVQSSWRRDAELAPGSLLLPPLQTRQLDVEGCILRSCIRGNSLIFRPTSQLLVSSAIAIDSVSMIANYASVYLVCNCFFQHMNKLIYAICSTQSLTGVCLSTLCTTVAEPVRFSQEIWCICRTSIGQVISVLLEET
jgi:hypothetical protein